MECSFRWLFTEWTRYRLIEIFEQMKALGNFTNKINFLGVLCARGHAGFLDKGWAYFNSMSEDYGITPLVYHYTCMVDLHERAGRISEAVARIQIYMHLKVCGTHF